MERNEMAFAAFGEVAERLRRSTVLIHSGSDGSRRGSGSGVICSDAGLIVTNAHVIRGSHACVQLWDGCEFQAQVTECDHSRDLAALRISAQGLSRVSIADSSRIRAGELALAIGNPLGFVGSLSTGVVHAVGPVRGLGPCAWVQANVRLAPGNFRRTACECRRRRYRYQFPGCGPSRARNSQQYRERVSSNRRIHGLARSERLSNLDSVCWKKTFRSGCSGSPGGQSRRNCLSVARRHSPRY